MNTGTAAIERALANGVKVKPRRANGAADTRRLAFTWATKYPPVTSPVCVVDGLIEAGTVVVPYGEANAGKSTWMLDVALSVARGEPWRGRRTRQGVVLWVALESSAGLRRRVAANVQRTGKGPGLFADVTETVSLLSAGDVAALLEAAVAAEREAGEKVALVVVDTVARALAGGDENDGQDMGLLIRHADQIRNATGAAVVLIHHSGKDSNRGARGHSSLRAAVDTEIEISGQTNPRMARVTKQRDLPNGDTFAFDLEPVEIIAETAQEPMTACVVVHREAGPITAPAPKGKAQSAILRALRNRQREAKEPTAWPQSEMRRIGRELGFSKQTAQDAVEALITNGFLIATVGGHRLAETAQ